MTRRDVIARATWIFVAPVIHLLLPEQPCTSASHVEPEHVQTSHVHDSRVVFMVHGWSVNDDCAPAVQAWITVGNSWRTAWR
ncbi:MAG: hypothetical protein JWO52_2042 [Gammaproteobacteria bacterium]|jgi:hypothetical protein|nr:hypothetical protein [Gammaproteobacteria bacterium]